MPFINWKNIFMPWKWNIDVWSAIIFVLFITASLYSHFHKPQIDFAKIRRENETAMLESRDKGYQADRKKIAAQEGKIPNPYGNDLSKASAQLQAQGMVEAFENEDFETVLRIWNWTKGHLLNGYTGLIMSSEIPEGDGLLSNSRFSNKFPAFFKINRSFFNFDY